MDKEQHDLRASEWKALPNLKTLRITPDRADSEIKTNLDLNLASGRFQLYETTKDKSFQRWIIKDEGIKHNEHQLTHTHEYAVTFQLWSKRDGEMDGFNVIVPFPYDESDPGKVTMRYDLNGNLRGIHVVTEQARSFEVDGDSYGETRFAKRTINDNFSDLVSIYRLDDLEYEEDQGEVDEIFYAETKNYIWNRFFASKLSIEDPETSQLLERLALKTAQTLPKDFYTNSKKARRTILESKLHKTLVMELIAYEETLKSYVGDEFEIHPGDDIDSVYDYEEEEWYEMQAGSEFLFGEYGFTLERFEDSWGVVIRRFGMFPETKRYTFPVHPDITKFKEIIQGDTNSGWQHAADHMKIEK